VDTQCGTDVGDRRAMQVVEKGTKFAVQISGIIGTHSVPDREIQRFAPWCPAGDVLRESSHSILAPE
jgi:hypothetical protein